MTISDITLRNIGPFADVTIDLPPSRGGGQFVALVGEGKTSALRGAALAVAGSRVSAACGAHVRYPIIRDGECGADASATIDKVTYATSLTLDRGECSVVQRRNGFDGFYAAYGVDRASVGGAYDCLWDIDERGGWRRIGSLFGDAPCVMRTRTVLTELNLIDNCRRGWRGEARERGYRYGDAYSETCVALASVLGASAVVRMGDHHVEVDGVPLPRLGDGANNLAVWVADLCARWISREVKAGRTVAPSFIEKMSGVCIIDGFDSRIHSTTQAEIIERVRETFPRMTFIVGVESPLTLSSLRSDEVVVLRRDDDGVLCAHHNVSEPRLRTGTEMLNKFFGVRGVFPSRYGRAWHLYGRHAGNPYRTDEEDAELREAKELLEAAGLSPGFEPDGRIA
jgi:hypothetical protein